MCGILAILNTIDAYSFRNKAKRLSHKLSHRGPDYSGIYINKNNILCHERLSIIDVLNGSQPIENNDVILVVNGEIYNYKELKKKYGGEYKTESDCEVLITLYKKYGDNFLEREVISGMYSFVLYDKKKDTYIIGRDPIGIIPLYYGFGKDGSIWVSSELKAIEKDCKIYDIFPPGFYYTSQEQILNIFYKSKWYFDMLYTPPKSSNFDIDKTCDLINKSLTLSVKKHLMCDVPYGILLSGGLDSSLIASIASREYKINRQLTDLHTYCIGLKGSKDIKAAEEVAKFIGSKHYSFEFTLDEGLDALESVIYHIETFDITTIRASTPMYLMARKIKASGIKMVLSGEGSDEIFGGYLYFHKAPNSDEFYKETVRKVKALHKYDCLRANKSMLAWGVEARVPFLDREFLDIVMNLDPKYKLCINGIEKYILRKSFDNKNNPYLPENILWRQKEQFSDGVGNLWIKTLKNIAEKKITDNQLFNAKLRFPYATPKTKEGYMYREIFEKCFPSDSACKTVPFGDTIACSSAIATKWDKSFQVLDPSGSSVKDIYKN